MTKNVSIIPYSLHVNHTSIELKSVINNEHIDKVLDQGHNETISIKRLQSKLKLVKLQRQSATLNHNVRVSFLTLGTASMITLIIIGVVILIGYLRCKSGNLRA